MNFKNLALKTIGKYLNLYAYLRPRQAAVLGLNLFCRPFAKKLKPHQKLYLQDAHYLEIPYNDTKIQTYKWGHGSQNILFIHGWASHSYRWRTYIESLVKLNYTVYAFDAPGHGLSHGNYLTLPNYSALIEQVTEHIGLLDAIVGHSFGGYAIIYWIFKYKPSSQMKTVIMAAPGEVADFMQYYEAQLGLSTKLQHYINLEFIHRAGKKPKDFSSSLLAKDFSQSGLIVHDLQDKDAHYQYSEKLHHVWTDSQFILTEGLGHSLKSNQVLKTVVEFITLKNEK